MLMELVKLINIIMSDLMEDLGLKMLMEVKLLTTMFKNTFHIYLLNTHIIRNFVMSKIKNPAFAGLLLLDI